MKADYCLKAPGTTLYWPTSYAVIYAHELHSSVEISVRPFLVEHSSVEVLEPSGSSGITCIETTKDIDVHGYFALNASSGWAPMPALGAPESVLSSMGFSGCVGRGGGVVMAQLPVLSLTSTLISYEGDQIDGSTYFSMEIQSPVSASITAYASATAIESAEASMSTRTPEITFGPDISAKPTQTPGRPQAAIESQPPMLTFGGSTYTADSASAFYINGTHLTPGQIATISGTAISLGSEEVEVGGATQELVYAPSAGTYLPAFELAGSLYAAGPASEYVIGSQTLVPGGPELTMSGTILSLASDAIVIDAIAHPLVPTSAAPFTLAGSTYEANGASDARRHWRPAVQ